MRERGLKPYCVKTQVLEAPVVPLAGTWIETVVQTATNLKNSVVPLAGTWIETLQVVHGRLYLTSFPLRERVLWSSIFVTLVAKKYRFMQFELDMVFDTH